MKMSIVFVNGPLHRVKADMTWLPQFSVITDVRQRLIYVYVRDGDDLVYYYDPELSEKFTDNYDAVRAVVRPNKIDPESVDIVDREEV